MLPITSRGNRQIVYRDTVQPAVKLVPEVKFDNLGKNEQNAHREKDKMSPGLEQPAPLKTDE